jgi:hypothetical protein
MALTSWRPAACRGFYIIFLFVDGVHKVRTKLVLSQSLSRRIMNFKIRFLVSLVAAREHFWLALVALHEQDIGFFWCILLAVLSGTYRPFVVGCYLVNHLLFIIFLDLFKYILLLPCDHLS